MTDFAWTSGTGAYKHYPQYVNLTGNRLTVRGAEFVNVGGHYEQGPTVSIELPDEVLAELRSRPPLTNEGELVEVVGDLRSARINLIASKGVTALGYLDSAIAALEAASLVTKGWEPIETAPKDGTDILAVIVGNHPQTGDPFIPEVVGWDADSAQWWNCMWCNYCDARAAYEPTHWRPLPDPPLVKGER
jgi:hypothetical protein